MEKVSIEVDKKIVPMPLPERLILYAVDSSHLLLAVKPIGSLETRALSKTTVKVASAREKYLIELPKKIYDFYHMDETDYTIMVSEIDPNAIEILL